MSDLDIDDPLGYVNGGPYLDPNDMPVRDRIFIVAFYEIDRVYGGPEEGGWWYDAGTLVRPSRIFKNERSAHAYANRANELLARFQRGRRPVHSVAYDGGRFEARVYPNEAPKAYPPTRPYYE